ncbi:MAG: GNAT family N-acyltransferase [bacterium]
MSYAARAVEGVRQGLGWLNPAQKDFTGRVPVEFTRGHFTVKTVQSKRELWQVMTLRYEVFHREYKHKKIPFGLDRDRFDAEADHLAIIDNRINRIVGTYRLISGDRTTNFYSKTEFDITDLLAREGGKVELSRACIHKDYRNGAVITLLWRGIIEYLNQSGARWLFGMASVKTINPDELAAVYRTLEAEGAVDLSFRIKALEGYRINNFARSLEAATVTEQSKAMVPALLRSYLRAGAVVVGDPAIDMDFNCGDLFVVFDVSKMSSTYNRKYQVN